MRLFVFFFLLASSFLACSTVNDSADCSQPKSTFCNLQTYQKYAPSLFQSLLVSFNMENMHLQQAAHQILTKQFQALTTSFKAFLIHSLSDLTKTQTALITDFLSAFDKREQNLSHYFKNLAILKAQLNYHRAVIVGLKSRLIECFYFAWQEDITYLDDLDFIGFHLQLAIIKFDGILQDQSLMHLWEQTAIQKQIAFHALSFLLPSLHSYVEREAIFSMEYRKIHSEFEVARHFETIKVNEARNILLDLLHSLGEASIANEIHDRFEKINVAYNTICLGGRIDLECLYSIQLLQSNFCEIPRVL